MSGQASYQITATLDGVPLGEFETRGGGATSAPDLEKRRPGGMRPEVVRPTGLRTTSDVTISRQLLLERDWDFIRLGHQRVNAGILVVNEQPLDTTGAPWGRPLTFTGVLSNVEPNEVDANAGGARTFELSAVVSNPT